MEPRVCDACHRANELRWAFCGGCGAPLGVALRWSAPLKRASLGVFGWGVLVAFAGSVLLGAVIITDLPGFR